MIVSILITILAIVFARPFLWLVGAQDDTIDFATTYFRFVSAGLIFNYIRLIICSGQRAIGKTNITLVTNVVSNVVNVFFNYCMITGYLGFKEMGVMGAAIATDIGNIVACIIAFFSVFHAKGFLSIHLLDDWRLSKSVIKNILNVSMAAFIEQLFMRVGFFIIAMIVNRLGTHTTAVNSVITNMMNMNFNITDGFAIGAGALVGRALGEKDLQKAFAYGRISQILSVVIAIITMILVIIFRYPLSRCFSNDESVVREAGDYIIYTSVIMLPQSLQWVTTGILRGAGDTKYTAKNSIISVTFIRPVFAYVLCYPLKFGLLGSWAGMLVDQIIRCVCNNIRFVNLKWMKLKV